MSIIQFARMLWARRLIIVISVVGCFLGGYALILVAPPRYEGDARVMLNLLRPDPVTGEMVNPRSVGAYIATEAERLKDYSVTGRTLEALGWISDPGYIQAYQNRPKTDLRDYRHWLADRVADRTDAKLESGSVLTISFTSSSPVEARIGAEAMRQAYIDSSLDLKRQDAAKTAAWYNNQAEQARVAAEQAENAKAEFERQSGIVMSNDLSDLDTERLKALANSAAVERTVPVAPISGASVQLTEVDAQIAELSKTLGPNHPEMQALRAKRAALAKVAAQESAAMRGASGVDVQRQLEAQKSRVISQRDKVERLRQLAAESELRREQYRKTAARAAELNLQASIADPGMKPLGLVLTPTQPVFPNKLLIMAGAPALGLCLGLGLALLLELLNRRVRSVEDLEGSFDVPCLGVFETRRRRLGRRGARAGVSVATQPAAVRA